MDEKLLHNKKLQGSTASACNYAMHQIKDAEGKQISTVIHDAAIYYTKNHPAVQKSVKNELNMTMLNDKMQKLSEISSKIDEFHLFEANLINFCINLNKMTDTDPRKELLIKDITTLFSEIKEHGEWEYEYYVKIASKLLSKKISDSIFTKEDSKERKTKNKLTEQERDRKELSTGQYTEKYNREE